MAESRSEETKPRIDYGIILTVMILALIGLVSIYFAVKAEGVGASSPMNAVLKQGIWYVIGTVAIVVIMQFDSEQLWKIAPLIYFLGMLLLVAVLFLYSRSVYDLTGAKSWFKFGSLTFQPSEIMKAAYILMMARVITLHNNEYHRKTIHGDFILFGKMIAWTLPVLILLIAQKDLGTTLVFVAIFGGMLLMSGISWKILAPLILLASAFVVGVLYLVTTDSGRQVLSSLGFKNYQFARIDAWLDPSGDTSNTSMQLWQSMKAIGSGRISGKGLGVTEVNVPVRESDMIFSLIGENFGFIGGCVLILLYFLLIYQMVRVCFDTKNEFYAYICTGVIMMILFHVFENIGMSIALLPLTGIPLPFISQGGTALLGNMIAIGLVMSMRYHTKSYMFSEDEDAF